MHAHVLIFPSVSSPSPLYETTNKIAQNPQKKEKDVTEEKIETIGIYGEDKQKKKMVICQSIS